MWHSIALMVGIGDEGGGGVEGTLPFLVMGVGVGHLLPAF